MYGMNDGRLSIMREVLRSILLIALCSPSAWADSPANPRCAVRLNVTASVMDHVGKPVPGAEVWFVDTLGGSIDPMQASLVGSSGSDGVVRADVCYQSELFYCANPPRGTSKLRWFILKENYGVVKVERQVSAARLVKEGWALSGEPCKGTATAFRIGEGGVQGFTLPLSVTLRPAQ